MKNLFTTILLAFVVSATAQIPTNGLVGAWTFNGNANDVSGNNNHGTVFGATLTADRCGNANSAYELNGTSNYIQTLLAGPSGTVSRSISMWAKTTATGLMTLFAYGNGIGGEAIGVQYNYNCPGVNIDVNNQAYTRGNGCILNNAWHHVVAIYDANISTQFSNIDIYVDGVLLNGISCVITGTTQTINTGTMFPMSFGRIHDNNARFFKGSIDDYYLYDRALTPQEVQQLYKACSPPLFGATPLCRNASAIYSITPVVGATSYIWSLPGTWSGSSSTSSIQASNILTGGNVQVTSIGSCGGTTTSSLSVVLSDCVGVEDFMPRGSMKLTYNANENVHTCESTENGSIVIYSQTGSIVHQQNIATGACKLSTNHLSQGIYYAKLIVNNEVKVVAKLLVQ